MSLHVVAEVAVRWCGSGEDGPQEVSPNRACGAVQALCQPASTCNGAKRTFRCVDRMTQVRGVQASRASAWDGTVY